MELTALIRQGVDSLREGDDAALVDRLLWYVLELDRWNRKINLTGKKGPSEFVRELLYDALYLSRHADPVGPYADMGSGSGVVAVVLALVRPEVTVYSIEKSLKKAQFQRHVRRHLRLGNLQVLPERAEAAPPLAVGTLVAKAFGSVDEVLRKGGRHVREGGLILMPRGRGDTPSDHEGFVAEAPLPYRLPGGTKEYQLFVYKKV